MENSGFCPFCAEKFTIRQDTDFELGKQVTCEKCKKKFNIFEIYKNIYEEIAIGKKIVDTATDIIYSEYTIEGDSEFGTPKIEKCMKVNFLDNTIVHYNS